MTAKRKRLIVGLAAVALVAFAGAQALAQCSTCGETVAYQPVTYQTYSPVTYTTYKPYNSWYPGYWIGRVNNYVWGRPWFPSYHAWYRKSYEVGYAPTTTSYYQPATSCCSPAPTCSSCTSNYAPSCSTCSTVSQVVMRPICSSGCDSYSSCSSCSTGVSQATYTTPGCDSCGVTQAAPQATTQQPTLSPSETPPAERTFRQKPTDDVTPTPEPAEDDNSASYFEAPQLFNPQDRTAQRSAAPVWNAVYHKTVASQVSAEPASFQQFDSSVWGSVSQ